MVLKTHCNADLADGYDDSTRPAQKAGEAASSAAHTWWKGRVPMQADCGGASVSQMPTCTPRPPSPAAAITLLLPPTKATSHPRRCRTCTGSSEWL